MSVINCATEDLTGLAERLAQAQAGMEGIITNLDRAVKIIEPKWGGDSQLAFMRFYKEWSNGMVLHTNALKSAADKIKELAEAHQGIG
jgi:uncharacterized protein YukE